MREYFDDYINKYHKMQKALENYARAKEDYYSLTGSKVDDMPKSTGKALGFDDTLARIEHLEKKYNESLLLYEEKREQHEREIETISDLKYRLILEYAYLDICNDVEVQEKLKKNHKLEYSMDYLKKMKMMATKEFTQKIINNTK